MRIGTDGRASAQPRAVANRCADRLSWRNQSSSRTLARSGSARMFATSGSLSARLHTSSQRRHASASPSRAARHARLYAPAPGRVSSAASNFSRAKARRRVASSPDFEFAHTQSARHQLSSASCRSGLISELLRTFRLRVRGGAASAPGSSSPTADSCCWVRAAARTSSPSGGPAGSASPSRPSTSRTAATAAATPSHPSDEARRDRGGAGDFGPCAVAVAFEQLVLVVAAAEHTR